MCYRHYKKSEGLDIEKPQCLCGQASILCFQPFGCSEPTHNNSSRPILRKVRSLLHDSFSLSNHRRTVTRPSAGSTEPSFILRPCPSSDPGAAAGIPVYTDRSTHVFFPSHLD